MFKLDAVIAKTSALVPPKSVSASPIPRAVWEAAVGTRIACRTEPHKLDKGVLHVRVTSAAWANELALLAGDILARLERSGIEATALRFTVAPLTTPQPKRAKPKQAAPPNAALPEELVPVVNRVADEGLRTALANAAAKSLAMKRVGEG